MAEPRFALRVFRVDQLLGQALDRALEPVGVGSGDFAVLSVVAVHEPVPPTALAELLRMPPTSLSTRLARLERRRLLRRRPNADDGRSRLIELTALGRLEVDRAIPLFAEFLVAVEGRLERPVAEIEAALADLEQALEPAAAGARSPRRR